MKMMLSLLVNSRFLDSEDPLRIEKQFQCFPGSSFSRPIHARLEDTRRPRGSSPLAPNCTESDAASMRCQPPMKRGSAQSNRSMCCSFGILNSSHFHNPCTPAEEGSSILHSYSSKIKRRRRKEKKEGDVVRRSVEEELDGGNLPSLRMPPSSGKN
ncbi:hypothetical protein CEXT_45051 [Caerostris extrusa]|uniref:Uncharacterized protein n=1 Tax=Caerostris extrusa TaxID=172846 RepID=A0AAV4URV5_CAEEX|nr:hypothetical protein CEXT_45051 [Caerostris extrusa]